MATWMKWSSIFHCHHRRRRTQLRLIELAPVHRSGCGNNGFKKFSETIYVVVIRRCDSVKNPFNLRVIEQIVRDFVDDFIRMRWRRAAAAAAAAADCDQSSHHRPSNSAHAGRRLPIADGCANNAPTGWMFAIQSIGKLD